MMLEVKDLSASYVLPEGEIRAVDDVSFSVDEGEILGIAGESGCGKSTLAFSISFLFPPPLRHVGGSVLFNGKDLKNFNDRELRKEILGTKISYVPQSSMNSLNPTRRVKDIAFDIFRAHMDISEKEMYERAKERLDLLSLPESVLNMYSVELSGGMKQRVVIALSTLLGPELLIADEPTSALDVSSQRIVLKELKKLFKDGVFKSMIIISHELIILKHLAHRIAIMYAGELVEVGETERIFKEPLHPYTKALIGSVLEPGKRVEREKIPSLPGAPPDLREKITWCRFYDRCPFADEKCKRKQELVERDGRLVRCERGKDI